MLMYLNNPETKSLMAEFLINMRTETTVLTSNEEFYRDSQADDSLVKVLYGQSLGAVPNKSFGIACVEQFAVTQDINLMKLFLVVKHGVLFEHTLPWPVEKFISNVELQRVTLKDHDKVTVKRDKLKATYQAERAVYRDKKSKIKAANKALKKDYEKSLKTAEKEGLDTFIKEPVYAELPSKPNEPSYPEYPKGYSLHMDRADQSFGWKLFSRFEFYKVKDSKVSFLKRRKEFLKFSSKVAVEVAEIKEITKEELAVVIAKSDYDSPASKDIKQSFITTESLELASQFDKTFDELFFSEEAHDIEEEVLPPLAPVKPMHAASMLAGGMGSLCKEIQLEGQPHLLKSAIIKQTQTRTVIEGNKEKVETVEFFEPKMGVYNKARRELRILG